MVHWPSACRDSQRSRHQERSLWELHSLGVLVEPNGVFICPVNGIYSRFIGTCQKPPLTSPGVGQGRPDRRRWYPGMLVFGLLRPAWPGLDIRVAGSHGRPASVSHYRGWIVEEACLAPWNMRRTDSAQRAPWPNERNCK
ncbi:hypothetical protein DPEC_G00237920 [Dallia pectoralis]|uniref:Uncharacterized protein n=1 Tax=Dallia pectoralis TaxID=75939 RepID=A0ACC2FYT4_DALPE|nr:hypothetical protein DPEC_G00237920 [Dallia pectoralis]